MKDIYYIIRTKEKTKNGMYRYLHTSRSRYGTNTSLGEYEDFTPASDIDKFPDVKTANVYLIKYINGQKTLKPTDLIIQKLVITYEVEEQVESNVEFVIAGYSVARVMSRKNLNPGQYTEKDITKEDIDQLLYDKNHPYSRFILASYDYEIVKDAYGYGIKIYNIKY